MDKFCIGLRFLLIFELLSGVAAETITQDEINYMANNIHLTYSVLDNFEPRGYKGSLLLHNRGPRNIITTDWEIYFNNIRMMEPGRLTDANDFPKPEGVEMGESRLRLYHINGCLFKLTPMANFTGIQGNSNLEMDFVAAHWHVAITDPCPNWYITAPGLEPRTILNTASPDMSFVSPIDSANKWKRYPDDRYDPYTPEFRYDKQDVPNIGTSPRRLLPKAKFQSLDSEKYLNLGSGDWVIIPATPNIVNEAVYLGGKLGVVVGSPFKKPNDHFILLQSNDMTVNGTEGYHLKLDDVTESINITAQSAVGMFYGVQSLISLANDVTRVPVGDVIDEPRFGYRGMHLDVGRHFHSKETVIKLLDVMATFKLNKFHFHLSEDEAWRLEIPGLPELTEVGGKRCHDLTEQQCIIPQFGSGPGVGTSGTGYYTVEDYRDILQYANDRHIEVIPEFDMPGHSHAAIMAMEARYLRYNSTNITEATRYRLRDPNDNTQYISVQMWTDDAIMPCIESTYTFVQHVAEQVKNMHSGIQELKIFNFGGDEVAPTAWVNSPSCKTLFGNEFDNMTNTEKKEAAKLYFVQRVANLTYEMGLSLAGWEDGLMSAPLEPYNRSDFSNPDVNAYTWDNVWELGFGARPHILANAGYKVILSPATNFYFDHPYEPDPMENGFYWAARYSDTAKVFNFKPDRVYDNIDVKKNGDPITKDEVCSEFPCPLLKKPENILGIQGQLWTETVRTSSKLDSMIHPRLEAMAERAWHKAAWEDITDKTDMEQKRAEDWQEFVNMLGHKEAARLDKMGVEYHLTPPGAKLFETQLLANADLPGLPLEYSENGGSSWTSYNPPVTLTLSGGKVQVRLRSSDYRRTSRVVQIDAPMAPVGAANWLSINILIIALGTLSHIIFNDLE